MAERTSSCLQYCAGEVNLVRRRVLAAFVMALISLGVSERAEAADEASPVYDVVVYGGTSGGVSAAIQTRRMGHSVVLIEPGQHFGGLTVSGLGQTDTGNKSVIGGISREFYQRVRTYYSNPDAWRQEKKAVNTSYNAGGDAMWTFEPHVAEKIMKDWMADEGVVCVPGESLNRKSGVAKKGNRIVSIQMKSGKVFRGRRFIDATYEGDLLAAAGVSYTVGREANSQYGESLNGVQVKNARHHQFVKPVDPFVVAGDRFSGLLPGINPKPPQPDGSADAMVQAYNYRICMTDAADNKVPFYKPEGYDPLQHELLLRNFEAGDLRLPMSIGRMPNRKTDLNNNFAVSSDWIGMNHNYPEADDETRVQILKDHQTYVQGFLWTLANHPRVPEKIRQAASRWGYSRDEFVDNNHFPYWCYIREGRRMVGTYVQTELDCRRVRVAEDSVGMGSYNMDSHHCQRYVTEEGYVRNEGDVQVSPRGPYIIGMRALLPRQEECENLAVPVCLSCTHIAYGSIRMEPVFMILGQSAATACILSLKNDIPLHDVPYQELRERLLADKQVLDLPPMKPSLITANLKGIVVDDEKATMTGEWQSGNSVPNFVGTGYLHDGFERGTPKAVTYRIEVPQSGKYDVRVSYPEHNNRATNALVVLEHQGEKKEARINQRQAPPIDGLFVSLGTVTCRDQDVITVTISNDGANGHVIADAVQLLPVE